MADTISVITLNFAGAGKATEGMQLLWPGIWRCQWIGAGQTCNVESSTNKATGFALELGMDLSDAKTSEVMRGGCWIDPVSSGAGTLQFTRASDG